MQSKGIVVSVACITYNHAPYIRQCLEGFLMQKTNFPIEIIVHDDASTDGTDDIIREYALKYPELFKVILQEENQYSKGVDVLSLVFERSAGKYIALCEGDDYWTDPLKLQKQVDFLENNPDYVMCSHNYSFLFMNEMKRVSYVETIGRDYSLESLTKGEWLYQPLTLMFRSQTLWESEILRYTSIIDNILLYNLLKRGGGYCMPDDMGVYRVHSNGVWSGINQERKLMMGYKSILAIYEVEQSDMAAQFLLTQFTKLSSRKSLIKQHRIILRALAILKKHYGLSFVVKLVFNKMFLNKNFKY